MNDMLTRFHIQDPFFTFYENLVRDVVLPYQEHALRDELPDAEKSHAVENFAQAAKMLESGRCDEAFYGMVFQDSDVAKWLEAAAYSLALTPDADLEARCDALIGLIGRAQHADGYLNTYFTVKEPARRWTNLQEAHELYCAGHMIEAAVAYAQCTGKTKLLDIMCRMADHIYAHFITGGAEGYPGHPEIELALMRLYQQTQNAKYLELAAHFVNVRGVDPDYFVKENARKGWKIWGMDPLDREYAQNTAPVRAQDKTVGHAVRAVYLLTGMAELAASGDSTLVDACKAQWENMTTRRMYVTGAIGSCYEGEAFTKDYHLPNDTAYAETCASIGLIFFARSMLKLEADSRYADAMERALYNCVLAGMQLDGKHFFYVNPLETIPGISGDAKPLRHALPARPKWFGCACCPPNIARLLPSIGCYAWSQKDAVVYSHLFIGGELALPAPIGGKLTVTTGYPYDGSVRYTFAPGADTMPMTLAIRLPDWSAQTKVLLNGTEAEVRVERGYACLTRAFTAQDTVELQLDMTPRRIFASQRVASDNGRVAFMRGPLVYCAEGVDHEGDVLSLRVKRDAVPEPLRSKQPVDCVQLRVDGVRLSDDGALYSATRPAAEDCTLTLVPYYTWGNRGLSQMRVWIPEY